MRSSTSSNATASVHPHASALRPFRMRADVPASGGGKPLPKQEQVGVQERLDPVGAPEPSVDRCNEWLRPHFALFVQTTASEQIARDPAPMFWPGPNRSKPPATALSSDHGRGREKLERGRAPLRYGSPVGRGSAQAPVLLRGAHRPHPEPPLRRRTADRQRPPFGRLGAANPPGEARRPLPPTIRKGESERRPSRRHADGREPARCQGNGPPTRRRSTPNPRAASY